MSDSDSDDENLIKYGTPLEPYEEDELPTKRKYQQQTDQYAVDAHGRRRFHGAFTGGFSAGFGNTVGTPEGWTPSTFKSSRSEKAQAASQRPEDFMDEEDRGEFGIAPRLVQTHTEFSGQKRQRQQRYHDGPIPGEPVLEQLVRAVHETAAVRILRGMGWRPGQGAGERLQRRGKQRAREQHRVYGCYMPPELRQNTEETQDSDDSSSSEYDFETLFAPDDYEPYILQRKNDRFGLGYSGLSRHSVLGTMAGEYGGDAAGVTSHLVMRDKGRKVSIRGQAFGVGAFEADDDDIYATQDMSHYDFALGPPAQDQQKKTTNKGRSQTVLQGFVKSSAPMPSVPMYPAPALPRDYAPARAGGRRSRFEPTAAAPRDQGLGRHELTASARGALLGETPIPKTTTQATTATENPPQTSTATENPPQTSTSTENQPQTDPITKVLGRNITFQSDNALDYIPITDSGKKLTKVFKPFVSNPQKQARYERYLEVKDGVLERDGDTDRLSEWERDRELAEFEQAAKLYRPLTGVMGDRFTHGTQPDDPVDPLRAVARSCGAAPAQAAAAAAQQGLYGAGTRRAARWSPEGLVCKRFNVPDPGGARIEQKKEDKPKVSYSVFSYLESSVHDKDSFAKEQSKFSGSKSLDRDTLTKANSQVSPKTDQNSTKSDPISTKSDQNNKMDGINAGFNKRMTVAELFLKESEKTKDHGNEVTETINQFDKMDLYKAIFLSDSEDETDVTVKKNDATDFIDVPTNKERNMSPPRGIFANIDFDELNSWKRIDKPETSNKTAEKVDSVAKITESVDKNSANNSEEQVYGPKIPDFLQKRLETEEDKVQSVEIESSSSEDSWVDVNELKNKKKKKKNKKHKSKHKKKSKSKKKDK